ncbi:glycosyltransferase family 2 protein [Clostridium sp. AM58-1XD]|uniref:glycosyltransferase family 2 protein n=1 Tax=Clostridium sp. AM58-1XD TaxID=2292307 RepID=UPI000E51979A|nr:glycosyltransferase family 2 protein [Clostridium sp. AM58-1XD]RGY94751.1 glycosyltransferase [Clostridium sp. AM58-1XD]
MKRQKISVVIPCYNSEKMIETVVDQVLEAISERKTFEYEIILVNDGSKDSTWNVIHDMAIKNPHIIAINFSRNFGQHSALMAAYRAVTGDIIVGLDDDGEHDPKEIYMLIDKLFEGFDYVCAYYEINQSKFRSLGTRVNNLMATILIDKPKEVDFSSYYAMKRFVIEEIIRYRQPYPYVGGLVLRATRNIGTVPLVRHKRLCGKSGYSTRKMIKLWFNGFTAFSVKPLRVATGLGVLSALIGFIGAIVLIIKRLFFLNYVPGYASTIVCIIFFCGMIMMLLGIIGEYVGRIYISINNAPQYVIRDQVGGDNNEENY